MKLRISFCNKIVLKTDIQRYAPLWGGYTLFLALVSLMCHRPLGMEPDYALGDMVRAFSSLASYMVPINGLYALAVGIFVWGDLLNPRMCVNLHALPVTRDSFFGAHLTAAMLFSFVPNVLVYGVSALLVPNAIRMAPLMAMAAGCLQYVFYLGAMLVAVQLAGSRLGLVLSYGMLNFFTFLLYWFCSQVFTPLTYGTVVQTEWLAKLCPTVSMYWGSYFRDMEHIAQGTGVYVFEGIQIGDLWRSAVLCALLGVVLMGLAQMLYRRRKLECAGDLLAYRGLSPVFLTMNTLMVAAFLHVAVRQMAYSSVSQYYFLPVGLILGYISGLMLLRRTTRVFRKRLLVPLAGMLLACGVAVCGIYIDALGIIRRVPEAEQVESIQLTSQGWEKPEPVTDREEIRTVLAYHRESLEGWQQQVKDAFLQKAGCWASDQYFNVRIRYTLKNGRTLARDYTLRRELPSSGAFVKVITCPETVLDCTEAQLRQRAETVEYLVYNEHIRQEDGTNITVETRQSRYRDTEGFADAVLADIRAGNTERFRYWEDAYGDDQGRTMCVGEVTMQGDSREDSYYLWFSVSEKTANTLRWLQTHQSEQVTIMG